jgi:hypothetical protein
MVVVGRLKEREYLEELGVDLKEIEQKDMDWINLVQARGRWRVVVNMIMNFWDQ